MTPLRRGGQAGGAIMIEPTETKSKETLDYFIDVMKTIAREAKENPALLHDAPHTTPVRRLDEVRATTKPVICAMCS